ncbi:hypothetical protein, partial [Aureimonas pseudogalii]
MPWKTALLSAACLVPLTTAGALAQTAVVTAAVNQSATGTPRIAAQRQALFAQMLADPSDLDAAFRYAA